MKKTSKAWYADFETTTTKINNERSDVYVWGLKCKVEQKMKWNINMRAFFETIKTNDITDIYFHNLSFEGWFIFTWLLNEKYDFINVSPFAKAPLPENTWTWIMDHKYSIYLIKLNYEGHEILFTCSYKLLSESIGRLGKIYGGIDTEKLSIDYDAYSCFENKKDVPPELLKYLERDIDIMIRAVEGFAEKYGVSITASATAMGEFKKFYGYQNFINDFGGSQYDYNKKCFETVNILSEEEWEICNTGYNGGYTNGNPKHKNKLLENISGYAADEISKYPGVCINHELPYGEVLYTPPDEGNYATMLSVLIIKAEIKKGSKMPPLIKKHSYNDIDKIEEELRNNGHMTDKYTYFVKNKYYVYWKQELEFLKRHYDMEYIILEEMHFMLKNSLGEFMSKIKVHKQSAKSKEEAQPHKILMNAFTGKFGQNYIREKKILTREKNENARLHFGKNNEWSFDDITDTNEVRSYVPIISYITMIARLDLQKAIEANANNFLYCDTDSIYTSGPFKTPKGQKLDDNIFGAWKYEGTFDKFKFLKPKTYAINLTSIYKGNGKFEKLDTPQMSIKSSGVPEDGKELLNWQNFERGYVIKNGKLSRTRLSNGILLTEADITL